MNERSPAKRGAVLSVVGPDGVGKSTLIDAMVKGVLQDQEILRIRNVGLLPRRTLPQVPVTEPHKDPPYSPPVSLLKVGYVYFDYLLGWFLRLRPFLRKGGWVVLERGWWDMAVDPTRYRMRLPSRLMWKLGKVLPHPDLLLVLEAPAEVVFERKKELPVAELRRQQQTWRKRLPAGQPHVFLDASLPASEVLANARKEIHRLRGVAGSIQPSRVVNLPRSTNTRWILPQAPNVVAAAGFRVYHPVTPKGLVGWELGKALTRLGLVRLFPAGSPPSNEVGEAIAEWIPPGGNLAVARANHAGRCVALLLAPDGTSVAVAKIASSEDGIAALEREADNITKLGDRLPAPLVAPKVLETRPGLLVLDVVTWGPRLRPWRLPPEVARAIGIFFSNREASADDGASHGDFAPWNLLKSGTEWVLIDWEDASERGHTWHDFWHYIVQGHALLNRPTVSTIRRGLGGRGWVGSALNAYAEGAAVSPIDASEALVSYLRTSMANLDTNTHDGAIGLDARRRLLLSMD